jgi:hypothetical protein
VTIGLQPPALHRSVDLRRDRRALPVSPDAVTGLTGGVTDKVPGMGAVSSVPGVGSLVPEAAVAEASGGHPTAGAILEPDQLASDLEQAVPGSDVLADAIAQVDAVGLGVTETNNMPEASGGHPTAGAILEPDQLASDLEQAVPGSDLLADAIAQVDAVGLGVTETNNMPEAKSDKVKAGQDTSVDADQNTSAEVPAGPLGAVPGGDLLSDLGGGLPVPLPF